MYLTSSNLVILIPSLVLLTNCSMFTLLTTICITFISLAYPDYEITYHPLIKTHGRESAAKSDTRPTACYLQEAESCLFQLLVSLKLLGEFLPHLHILCSTYT